MAKSLVTILTFFIALCGYSQFYIRGDVKDAHGIAVQNAKIYRPSTKSVFYTGHAGGFGIPSAHVYDSLIITKDGYDSVCVKIKTDQYQKLTLHVSTKVDAPLMLKMASFTTGIKESGSPISVYRGETYSNLLENTFVKTSEAAQTTFGVRIDKASYSNIRRFLNHHVTVPPDAVRIDEMLNYFNLNYHEPEEGKKFRIESQITDCPWNPENRLMLTSLSAKRLNFDSLPASNFVFLIDVSGSMDMPNRLPLLKEAFQSFVKNIRAIDTVSIVVYGGTVGVWLTPSGGDEKEKISRSIEELYASGDTPGESAIRTAYRLAKSTFIEGGNNRVILATDGDFNIGVRSEKELEELILKQREEGIYLTCLGVGMGNYKDSKIETLAKKGRGNFAYIDNIAEAEKVLVQEFTHTMYSVASDVYVDVKFDSNLVEEYRLIGYDNKKSEFRNFIGVPEGGEIGSASGNTIVFELKPAQADDKLMNKNLGMINIHYKLSADDTASYYINEISKYNYRPLSAVNQPQQFATAVVMFGLKLKNSMYLPPVSWDEIKSLAERAHLKGDFLQEQMLELIDKSKSVYGNKRKRWR